MGTNPQARLSGPHWHGIEVAIYPIARLTRNIGGADPANASGVNYGANVHAPGVPSPDGYNRTRNDIVNQTIGNFTTQGNVFSVWLVGQSLKKNPKNLTENPEEYEPDKGEQITGETRMRFFVERKLDSGVDGVYGNSRPGAAGADGVLGTPGDPVDAAYHPSNPKFIYQVIGIEETF